MSENHPRKIEINDTDDPLVYYRLTPEELRALQECDRESFYLRCLPFMTILSGSTYLAVNRGLLKPNARFGAAPKMSLAIILGYFIGKLSYQQRCAEKLMALPNSYIGQQLRLRQQGRLSQSRANVDRPMLGANPKDIYSDAGTGSSLNMDSKPNESQGDGKISSVTYDDLRRKNRTDFYGLKEHPKTPETSKPPQASDDKVDG